MNWKVWGQGLLAAVTMAAADAAATNWADPAMLTDPTKLKGFGLGVLFKSILAFFFYIKTHPLGGEQK